MKTLISAIAVVTGLALVGCSSTGSSGPRAEPKTLFPSKTRMPERNDTYMEPVFAE
ncbi:hypothetical protein [Oryzicola mucosus]|uniref:Uncharacterized protein n=1 Tax=Oryzicola mucosus TaxID=2767425 RepID=A0A8J6PKU6_9HYPH|nr:hypothetical protein [Oryzicola mucosus]MBD0413152.1 hypothetical protein [Oryzicola mucosus]